jgi:hypothetical protein
MTMLSRVCFLAPIFVLTLLTSCTTVADREWHTVCNAGGDCPTEKRSAFVKEQACLLSDVGRRTECRALQPRQRQVNVRTAYLELEEHEGKLRDEEQLLAIEEFIENQASSGRPLLIAVYVHGWHHDASPDDGNAAALNDLLARYAYSLEQTNHSNVDVFGIYVGWRGELYKSPINTLTIKSRAVAADTIGWGGDKTTGKRYFEKALVDIADTMRKANSDSHMIVMGHSLGGRIVSRALLPEVLSTGTHALGPNVLVTTVNAAIGAEAFRDAYEQSQTSATPTWPTWINLTSMDDDATLGAYHLGLRTGFIKPDVSGLEASEYTIGHYAPYVTHVLGVLNCAPTTDAPGMTLCGPVDQVIARSQYLWSLDDFRFTALQYGLASPSTGSPLPKLVHCGLLTRYPMSPTTKKTLKHVDVCGKLYENFKTADVPNRVPGRGGMWNISTDKSVIDFEKPDAGAHSTHNGYVQTDLTLLLVQLLYRQGNETVGFDSPVGPPH